jgi:hypothetical protein
MVSLTAFLIVKRARGEASGSDDDDEMPIWPVAG